LVNQTLSEYRAAEGPADERCYHRLSQCPGAAQPNQMCENLWILPTLGMMARQRKIARSTALSVSGAFIPGC
jgi:hypothetical protein